MEEKETKIFCKKCGKIIEWKSGIPVNKIFLDEFDLESPRYTLCYECRKKWSEKNLKCQDCSTEIDMHNYLFHKKLCDTCYNEKCENFFKAVKRQNSK